MKKSTEFVLNLLVTIIEPLITLVTHIIDSRERQDQSDNNDQDEE